MLCVWLGWGVVLAVHLPVVAIAGALGVWLFYVQHSFEESYWVRRSDWDPKAAAVDGSSFYDLPAGVALDHRQHRLSPHPPSGAAHS